MAEVVLPQRQVIEPPMGEGFDAGQLMHLKASESPSEGYSSAEKLGFRSVSFRSAGTLLGQKDKEVIAGLLANDPRLEKFKPLLETVPSMEDPKARAQAVKLKMDALLASNPAFESLSPNAKIFYREFIKFYRSYLTPFPDPTETDEAPTLFTALTGEGGEATVKWDIIGVLDKEGNILGATSGQLNNHGLAWNQHTWRLQDPELRGSRIGTLASQAFEERAKLLGSTNVYIEVDNPLLLSDEIVAHNLNPEGAADRRKYWVEEGHSMDPYDRFKFWSKQGFKIIVGQQQNISGGFELVAANNSQIALAGNDEGCTSLVPMLKPLVNQTEVARLDNRSEVLRLMSTKEIMVGISPKDIAGTIFRDDFNGMYTNMQATLSDDYHQQREYQTAIADNNLLRNTLLLLDPTIPQSIDAIRQRSVNEKTR